MDWDAGDRKQPPQQQPQQLLHGSKPLFGPPTGMQQQLSMPVHRLHEQQIPSQQHQHVLPPLPSAQSSQMQQSNISGTSPAPAIPRPPMRGSKKKLLVNRKLD